MKQILFTFCLMAAFLCILTACGRRASELDAPQGSDPKAYPRPYPDANTDPEGRF